MEVGNSKKRRGWCALRSGRRKASVSFSDRAHPPPFRLFLLLTTKVCRFIKPDVYRSERGNRIL
ncbi:hypothetical protein HMPREF0083_04184 [Aneurinibacillus aneurinilyticus ATCC 12856]|uniref:Uncharacterized protein n=1 Tax=Aneurinibacillus aneurinilyticus ATCC 12856 TaxID=649747 RepID=U1WZQ2_ANEAE|nr:hypothetical protein HMPREF0083_04184 [Aneurinibacillus aneurinilyticus ATCC 12856]